MIRSYITYLLRAKTRYGVHSPFIFDFQNNVLRSSERPKNLGRKELMRNQSIIQKKELGAGSRKKQKKFTVAQSTKTSALPCKYSKLLYNLVRFYQPTNVLELGTHFGIGTLAIQKGAKKSATITSIEGCPETYNIAKNHFKHWSEHPDNITLYNEDFDTFIRDYKQGQHFDLFYIDGNHQKEATLRYVDFALKNSTDNAIIVLDDIHWSKGMETAWEKCIQNKKVSYSVDLFRMGILFLGQQLQKQHFFLLY